MSLPHLAWQFLLLSSRFHLHLPWLDISFSEYSWPKLQTVFWLRTHQCLGNCTLLEKWHLVNPYTTSAFLMLVVAMVLMQSVNLSKYIASCLIILPLKLDSTVPQSSWAPVDSTSQIFLFLLSCPKRRKQSPNCHCQMSYYLLTSLGCHNFYFYPHNYLQLFCLSFSIPNN